MELLLAVRVDSINPVHTRLSIFSNSKRNGTATTNPTGLSGQLCIDTELLADFLSQPAVVKVTIAELVKNNKDYNILIPWKYRRKQLERDTK